MVSTNWYKENKNSTNWTRTTINSTNYLPEGDNRIMLGDTLLLETGDNLLLETGDNLLLEPTT